MLNNLPCPDVKKRRKIGIVVAKTNPGALEGQFEVTIRRMKCTTQKQMFLLLWL